MNVVMVHDCAYVGYELRKELMKRSVEVEHVFFSGSPKVTTLRMALKLRRMKCDLIHAHFCRSAAYASYLSGKSYIIHCHGSDIRGGVSWLQRKCLKKAKRVLVSTPDLLEILPDAIWLRNPVDTKRFRPLKEHSGNKVLYFHQWYENISDKLKEVCERIGYDLTISIAYSIPYAEMHLFLNDFDIFVDRFSIRSYSKTALEAMACGLAVVGYRHDLEKPFKRLNSSKIRRKWVMWQNDSILSKHNLNTVTGQLLSIYRQILAGK